jgi:hypothetical protein
MTRKELEHVIFVLSSARSMATNDPFWRVGVQEALASCRVELGTMPKEEPQQLELDFGQQRI